MKSNVVYWFSSKWKYEYVHLSCTYTFFFFKSFLVNINPNKDYKTVNNDLIVVMQSI